VTYAHEAAADRIDAAGKLRRSFERRVARACDDEALWPPDGRILVAVSGGPDSSALLLILAALARRRKLSLTAAYFDHRLRGASAARLERKAVEALAGRCGVELVAGAGDVKALRRTGRLTLEEAARRARYNFLAAAAEDRGIATVAAGHTLDDQAETVLMHLLRGSGLAGIAGMHPRSRWPSAGHDALAVVRPLLFLRRADTEGYCRAAGWQPVEDVSNRSPEFLRNRTRRDLLPELRRYNPKVDGALARLAHAAREDLAALEELASPALEPATRAGEVRLDRARLRSMPPGLRKHAMRLAALRLLGDLQGFSERHIASIEGLASGPASGGTLDLPRDVTATAHHDALVLARGGPAPSPALPAEGVRLPVPGEARLGPLVATAGPVAPAGAMASVSLDAGALGAELCVRRWRAGDRMQPAGMTGTKKLQDIFVDARVPREQRGAVPVFESARGIAWLGGLRLAEWARPRDGEPTMVLSYREAP
jgi:tRNA(Ile)-lysidine synthase